MVRSPSKESSLYGSKEGQVSLCPVAAGGMGARSSLAQRDGSTVGKEMSISRIVVAVPNATVVLLD
jgi:hypothetical protein